MPIAPSVVKNSILTTVRASVVADVVSEIDAFLLSATAIQTVQDSDGRYSWVIKLSENIPKLLPGEAKTVQDLYLNADWTAVTVNIQLNKVSICVDKV
jgi:hypothetical protein